MYIGDQLNMKHIKGASKNVKKFTSVHILFF